MADTNPLDPSNFRQFILEEPTQFAVGFDIAKGIKLEGTYKRVVLSGMGGSALPGNLLAAYLTDLFAQENKAPIPFLVNRTYSLPREAYSDCINLIVSYSGNTEETVASFEEAHNAGLACIGMSSGGKIEEMCREWGVPHIKLPMPYPTFQPRMGTGYIFSAILGVLINQGMIPDVKNTIVSEGTTLAGKLESSEEKGKALAQKIAGKTPIVFASFLFYSLAMVWKIKINENAKTPAYYNFFPELDHNEMVGYTNPQAKFITLMLRDPQDNPRNLARYQATADLIREKGVESEMIDLQGNSVFEKIFSSILLADFTSYNLALLYKQDPTPVDMVEKLKKILAS